MDLKQKILLVLVTGFLGSGKTTLVKYLLGNLDPNLSIGIIQNEYASANIDTSELRTVKRKFEVPEINNGSVFCVCLLGSFIESFAEFMDKYKPDLVIRTSRLIHPKGLELFLREVENKLVRLKGYVLLTNKKVISIQSEFGQTRMNEVVHYKGNTEIIGLDWNISPASFGRRFHDIRKISSERVS